MDHRSNITAHYWIAPGFRAGFDIQGTKIALLRVTEEAACARIEQTVGNDRRPAQYGLFPGCIEPADLPVLGVDGIDPPVGRGRERLVSERMERKRSLL